jgi:hypothetical protein
MAGEGTPVRSILASFTVEVDRAGALAKGATQVDVFKSALVGLETQAVKTAKAISDLFAKATAKAAANVQEINARAAFGGGNTASAGGGWGGVIGLAQQKRATDAAAAAKAAADRAANSIGGRFRAAVDGVRNSLNTPRFGFIPSLFTMQNAFRGLAVVGAGAALKGLVDQIGGIGEEASKLGVANDEFQRLSVLAAQNATSVGALSTAFRTLASAAVEPTKESAEAFRELGVDLKNADGSFKSRQDLFFETAGALADIEDGTLRAATAQKVYGRSSRELAPLLAGGRAGLEAQRAELEKLPVLSDDVIAAADRFSDRWEFVKVQLLALAGPVLEKVVIPAMQFLLDTVSGAADGLAKLTKNLSASTIALAAFVIGVSPLVGQLRLLVALGGGTGAVFRNIGRGALTALKSVGPLVAAFLLLEDVFTFFAGGDSLVGDALDAVFGAGTGAGVQKTIVDLTEAFKDLWKWVLGDGAGEKAKRLFGEIGEAIELMVHDALVTVGIRSGETGLSGLNKFKAGRDATTRARGELDAQLPKFMPGPNGEMIPIPGTAGLGANQRSGSTVIDNSTTSVVVQTQTNASPAQIAKAVSTELNGDNNRLVAGAP